VGCDAGGLFRKMMLGDGVGLFRRITLGEEAGFISGEETPVQEPLGFSWMIGGVAPSFMGGAGAAIAAATNKEAKSAFENMTTRL